ncbi:MULTISPECIES: hypothetical protein [Rhizobium]|uniref:hypothetical protein n=1 Tax=Rhizobium TaxID=379 RepID=UPI0021B0F215|nr:MULTISPECIES: hypothetical protein [Rhizobium]
MAAVLKSLDVPRGDTAQNATNFGIPKRGNFGIPKWDFFFMAMLTRMSAAIGAASDGRNRVGRRLSDYSAFHLDAGLEDQDCNLFWLIGSFVNLLSRQKDASSDPECSVYRSTNSVDRHRSAPGASIAALQPGCQHRP